MVYPCAMGLAVPTPGWDRSPRDNCMSDCFVFFFSLLPLGVSLKCGIAGGIRAGEEGNWGRNWERRGWKHKRR